MTKAGRTQERKLSRRQASDKRERKKAPSSRLGALDLLVQDNQEVEEWFDEHDLLRDDNKIAREARHDRYRCRRDERLAEQPHVTP